MLIRYKRSFDRAISMLHRLRKEPSNVELCYELQKFLLEAIKQAERKIPILRKKISTDNRTRRTNRLSKEQSNEIKAQIKRSNHRITFYQHLIYLWKCFGDGIAFIYLDKYSLKQTYFDQELNVKESPGFLSGKDGLKKEWSIVRNFTQDNLNVLLCDLTNVLKYGDICALVGPDPLLIEVKSGKNTNKRVVRQQENLQDLQNFLLTDQAENYRGTPYIARQALTSEELNYNSVINECLRRSYTEGTVTLSPEEGIFYCSVYGDLDPEKLFPIFQDQVSSIDFYNLNHSKNEQQWNPYYPFVLSIAPEYLFDFIIGNVTLLIAVDLKILKKKFAEKGVNASVICDGNWLLQLNIQDKTAEEGIIRVSDFAYRRIIYDFQSLDYFSSEHSSLVINFPMMLEKGNWTAEIPKGWLEAKDVFDNTPTKTEFHRKSPDNMSGLL